MFCASTPKEKEDISVSLPCIEQVVHYHFFLTFLSSPVHAGCRKGLEDKICPAMNLQR